MTDIPQTALRGRQRYAAGDIVRDICADTKLSRWQLYFWIDGGPKRNGMPALPPLPRRDPNNPRRPTATQRSALVVRLLRAAERQVEEIERRLVGEEPELGDRERDARTLAVLARTMRELTALDALNRARSGRKEAMRKNDEPVPRDVGELRRSLARKLEEIVAESAAEISDET